jgi:hypothetical protein
VRSPSVDLVGGSLSRAGSPEPKFRETADVTFSGCHAIEIELAADLAFDWAPVDEAPLTTVVEILDEATRPIR